MTPADVIDRIRERVPIERLLERDGVRHQGRAWHCPFHRDRVASAAIRHGRLHCFTCNRWWDAIDYLRERDGQDFKGAVAYLADLAGVQLERGNNARRPAPAPYRFLVPRPEAQLPQPAARADLVARLESYQRALIRDSIGATYLLQRGIPLDLARRYGIGYAACGEWAGREWPDGFGRVVFPHTGPAGKVVNLYGRLCDPDGGGVPRNLKHDHLAGPKGYFNTPALASGNGPLYITEGPFDAISLVAAGALRTVAIFGVAGWRWDWAQGVTSIVLALDSDTAGQRAWRDLAIDALMRSIEVNPLPPGAYGRHKDANAAWAASALDLRLAA